VKKKAGKRIFIYGLRRRPLSPILRHRQQVIAAAVDKNSDKWGKHIVGTGIQYSIDIIAAITGLFVVLPYQFKQKSSIRTRLLLNGQNDLCLADVELYQKS